MFIVYNNKNKTKNVRRMKQRIYLMKREKERRTPRKLVFIVLIELTKKSKDQWFIFPKKERTCFFGVRMAVESAEYLYW
jgi:hypothetical protein